MWTIKHHVSVFWWPVSEWLMYSASQRPGYTRMNQLKHICCKRRRSRGLSNLRIDLPKTVIWKCDRQSSWLNSVPTEVDYIGHSVTSSLHTTLHIVARLERKASVQKCLTPCSQMCTFKNVTCKLEKKWCWTNPEDLHLARKEFLHL